MREEADKTRETASMRVLNRPDAETLVNGVIAAMSDLETLLETET